eukprot:326580-Heterocapsa_arctica.AAC.1
MEQLRLMQLQVEGATLGAQPKQQRPRTRAVPASRSTPAPRTSPASALSARFSIGGGLRGKATSHARGYSTSHNCPNPGVMKLVVESLFENVWSGL